MVGRAGVRGRPVAGGDPVALARGLRCRVSRNARAPARPALGRRARRAGTRRPLGACERAPDPGGGCRISAGRDELPRGRDAPSWARHRRPAQDPRREPRARPAYSPLITASVSPLATDAPTAIGSSETLPALWAVISFSIFIASITAISVPSSTVAPCSTATLSTVPCRGETSVSPLATATPPPARSLRRDGLRAAGAMGSAPLAVPFANGGPITRTSKRLPDTSTV